MRIRFRLPTGSYVEADFNGHVPRKGETVDFGQSRNDVIRDEEGQSVTSVYYVQEVVWEVGAPPERTSILVTLRSVL